MFPEESRESVRTQKRIVRTNADKAVEIELRSRLYETVEYVVLVNIRRFLLELGTGFAYVGSQMELRMPGGTSYFPDMVFYHTKLKCYVVLELKVVEFEPEFAGKLNFYVSAADHLLKDDNDNPSI